MAETIRALLLGDIIGQPGCRALFVRLSGIVKQTRARVVVVNGENAADGYGITPELADTLFGLGIDVITTGNHVWQRKEIYPSLESYPQLLRPANYPNGAPGHGTCIVDIPGGKVAVVNLQGRSRMSNIDCPFQTASTLVKRITAETKTIIIDFHAEATDEKEALALYLDGRVSAVVGTHTHVPTADERILPAGTAFVTDLGMVGAEDSVIGVDPDVAIRRSLTQMPLKLPIADLPAGINGVSIEIDTATGKAVSIERIHVEGMV